MIRTSVLIPGFAFWLCVSAATDPRSVAAAEASSGITVNMISPGLMEDGDLPADSNVPAGRLGTFQDVSGAVQFLVSPKAGYITGANVVVAGGWKL